jgi:hypothetical protein
LIFLITSTGAPKMFLDFLGSLRSPASHSAAFFVCLRARHHGLSGRQLRSFRTVRTAAPLPRGLRSSRLLSRVKTWPDCHTLQQIGSACLDTRDARPFNSPRSGEPIALIGQEGIRCGSSFRWRANSGAAPATVGGEPFSKVPLGFALQSLGRRRTAITREPGDLPERSHPTSARGARLERTSAVVTDRLVTRMRPPC